MKILEFLCVFNLVVFITATSVTVAKNMERKSSKLKDVPVGGMSMYEISTRPWLYNLTQKYGYSITELSQVPDEELQAIAAQGFDVLWMMGLWHLGPYGLNHDRTDPSLLASYAQVLPGYTTDDIIGSPYAVTNYTCNPELGTDEDLLDFKDRVNNLGMKLMVDFVPNHSAVDCPWTSEYPNYYVRAPKGTQPPYDSSIYLPNGIAYGSVCSGCGAWTDTAQFNYWDDDARQARLNDLLTVASFADAIRCDMAYLLLNDLIQQDWGTQLSSWGYSRPATEWWEDSITTVKQKYPDIIFLAEVYSPYQPDLQNVGFDYTYDKDLYDNLGSGNLDNLRGLISGYSMSYIQHSAHFISNHDQERAAQYFGSWWRADAAALVTFTLPGMRFYWMWEFDGFANKLDVHLRREESEPVVQDCLTFYDTFLPIVMDDVFKYGTWTYLTVSGASTSWRLMAWKWNYNNEKKRLCVLNYSDTEGQGSIIVPDAEPVNGNDTIPVTDLLSGTTYWRSASAMRTTGIYVIINSWYAQIFEY